MHKFFATIRRKIEQFDTSGRTFGGFTIAEVLIASSVFVVVSLLAVTVFVDVMRIQRRIILENAIYEDARFMMERIAREIRYNTVDYEEYYRDALTQSDPSIVHGEYFGCYTERFYNPGDPPDIGAVCSDPPLGDPFLLPDCVIDKNSLDLNTGQNPYTGNGISTEANAFCDIPNIGDADCTLGSSDVDLQRDELYLINPAGSQKTYMGRKLVNSGTGEHSVGLLKLNGEDGNNDGIFETWHDPGTDYDNYCAEGYDCPSGIVTNLTDNLAGTSGGLYEGFVPVTPLRTDVTQLQFLVSPAEDPRKAFAETNPAEEIQQQPHVTVIMSVQPAESELQGFAGDPPTVTLQSTITSRVYNEVKSYLGEPVCP